MSSLAAAPHLALRGHGLPAGALGAALGMRGGAAAATGRALDAHLRPRIGVVGAVRGGLLRGLSNLPPVPHPSRHLFSLIRRGGSHALALATKGAKKAGALARAVGRGVANAGRAVAGFFDSPGGRLLSTALSLAATFIPGGIVVKAGIGAIAGTIDALAKGGGLKQALIGAAAGAVDGILPVAKLGALAKLALGSGKGALFAAAGGGGLGDIATGALGGAVGAGGAALRARRLASGGLARIDRFFRGGGRHRGALARLQSAVATSAGRRAWSAVHRRGRQALGSAAWVLDRSGRAVASLQRARYFLDVGQGVSDAVQALSSSAAERLSDGLLKRTLGGIATASGSMLGTLERVNEHSLRLSLYAERLNSRLPLAIALLGEHAGANKATRVRRRSDARRQELLRRRDDERVENRRRKLSKRARRQLDHRDLFARFDDFTALSLHRISRLRRDLATRVGPLPRLERTGRHAAAWRARVERWEHVVRIHGPVIGEALHRGTESTKDLRDLLRSVVLAAEDEDGQVDPAFAWLHEAALEWELRLDVAHRTLRAAHGATALTTNLLDVLPDPSPEFRKRLDDGRRAANVRAGRAPPDDPSEEVDPFVRLRRRAQDRAVDFVDHVAPPSSPQRQAFSTAAEKLNTARRALSTRLAELTERHVIEPAADSPDRDAHAGFRAIAHLAGGPVAETFRVEDWRSRQTRIEASRLPAPRSTEGDRVVREIRAAAEASATRASASVAATEPPDPTQTSTPDRPPRFDEVPADAASRGLYALLSRLARAVRPGQSGEDPETLDAWEQEIDARIDASLASGLETPAAFALECAEALRLLREQRAANEATEAARVRGDLTERPVRIAPPPDLVHLDADSTAPTPTRHAPVGEAAASRPLRETWEADGVVEDVDGDEDGGDEDGGDEDGGDEDGDTDAVAAPKAPLEAPLPNSEPAASPSRFPAPASTPAGAPPAFGRAVGKLFEHSRRRRVHGSDRPPRIRVGLDRPRALDLSLISRMERFLGERLPPVRIHTGSAAARLTRRLDADAATIGTHVFFAPGRFQPDTTEGRRLLAHELTHVLQRNRPHLDRRTAEAEAHRAEARFEAPQMEWFDPSLPEPPFRSAVVDGGGAGAAYAARRDRPAPWRGEDDGTFDEDAFLEALTERTVALLERAARDERIG